MSVGAVCMSFREECARAFPCILCRPQQPNQKRFYERDDGLSESDEGVEFEIPSAEALALLHADIARGTVSVCGHDFLARRIIRRLRSQFGYRVSGTFIEWRDLAGFGCGCG